MSIVEVLKQALSWEVDMRHFVHVALDECIKSLLNTKSKDALHNSAASKLLDFLWKSLESVFVFYADENGNALDVSDDSDEEGNKNLPARLGCSVALDVTECFEYTAYGAPGVKKVIDVRKSFRQKVCVADCIQTISYVHELKQFYGQSGLIYERTRVETLKTRTL